jgi:ABC-type multidrug transport system fused ATPase/permease subunit
VSEPRYRAIARYLVEFRRGLSVALLAALLCAAAAALQPWPIRYLVDGVLADRLVVAGWVEYPTETTAQKLRMASIMVGVYICIQLLLAASTAATSYWITGTVLQMVHVLRGRLLAHLRSLSLTFHASHSSGDLIHRSINDVRAIQEVVMIGLQAWIVPAVQGLIMIALMLTLDPVLTALAAVSVPALIWLRHVLTGRIQRLSEESRAHMGRLTSLVQQTIASMRAIQVFGREAAEKLRFNQISQDFVKNQLRFRTAEQTLTVATMAITALVTSAVLMLAVDRVARGALTVGALWVFLSYLQEAHQLIQRSMQTHGRFQDALVGTGRALEVLSIPIEIADRPGARPVRSFEQQIEFSAVGFGYGAESVLSGVDLVVRRGETVALIGKTGSGKSSLLTLIPRLHDVSKGALRIDGTDVREIELASLRDLISLVPQEALLFATTVRENIRYGRLDATDQEVEAAAREARADGFISELPEGYGTHVGDRGARLSIGQQQRISIARAFLKNAPILLLDEPTSALDARTEEEVVESLKRLMAGRTVILVTHRTAALRAAQRIYELDRGRIRALGLHLSETDQPDEARVS